MLLETMIDISFDFKTVIVYLSGIFTGIIVALLIYLLIFLLSFNKKRNHLGSGKANKEAIICYLSHGNQNTGKI